MNNKLSREELVDLVNKIIDCEGAEALIVKVVVSNFRNFFLQFN